MVERVARVPWTRVVVGTGVTVSPVLSLVRVTGCEIRPVTGGSDARRVPCGRSVIAVIVGHVA